MVPKKLFDARMEREPTDSHVICIDPLPFKHIKHLCNSRIATSDRDNSEPSFGMAYCFRQWHRLSRRLMLAREAIDDLLIFGRNFGVTAQLVMPRTARHVSAYGMDSRKGPSRYVVSVFVRVTVEGAETIQIFF